MVTKLISFTFAIVSTLFLAAGLLMFYTTIKLVNAEFYDQAFTNTDFPARSEQIIQSNLDNYLKDNIKVNENNEFAPNLAARIIRTILLNIDYENTLQETWENNTEYLTSWLSGKSELFLYFPRQSITEKYIAKEGDEEFITDFMEVSGYQDLPLCSSNESFSSLDFLTGEFQCSGPELQEFIRDEFEQRLPNSSDNILEGFLDSVAPDLDEKISVREHFGASYNNSEVTRLPNIIKQVRIYSVVAVLTAIVFGGLSIWFSPRPALGFIKILLNVGVLLVIFSLVAKVALRIIADFLLWRNINFSPDVFSDNQIEEIMSLVKDFFGALLDKLLLEILIMGLIVLVVGTVLFVIFRFARILKPKEYEDSDEESEEDELIEEDSPQEPAIIKSAANFEQSLLSKKPVLE